MVISVIGGKWKQEVVPKVSPSLLLLFLWGGGGVEWVVNILSRKYSFQRS